MKTRWYKSGKSLLNEIADSAPPPGTMYVWYLGQHGFALNMEGVVFYIDVILNTFPGADREDRRNYPPPFAPDEAQRVDYYIATHNHGDHLNLKTIAPLAGANPDCVFIVPGPWVSLLTEAGAPKERVLGAFSGKNINAGGITITPLPSIHTPFIQEDGVRDENGDYIDLGFLLRGDGLTFYHPGDTWITQSLVARLKSSGPIDIAALPINGTDWERTARNCIGNVSAMDAVKLAMAAPVEVVIPSHYDMFEDNSENPAYFADCMYRYCPDKRYHISALGEKFVYEKDCGGRGRAASRA